MASSSLTKGYLHIGFPKTGTTTIQNTLFKQRDILLARCGVLYPSIEANHTTPLCTMFLDNPMQHVTNKVNAVRSDRLAGIIDSYFHAFDSEIASTQCRTLLLSAEGLSNLGHTEIKKLKTWVTQYAPDWTVIIWVRHPIDITRSVTQQLLKGGYTLDQLEQNPVMPNFEGKLSNWIDVFGRENLNVQVYEESIAAPGGILRAFNNLIGIDAETSTIVESLIAWENQSLSHEAALVLSSLNRQRPLFDGSELALRRTGTEVQQIERITGQKFELAASVLQSVRIKARKDVEWLNKTFGLNVYLDVFNDEHAFGDSQLRGTLWTQRTVDAVAIALSDLLNTNYFYEEMTKGNQARQRSEVETAIRHFQNAHRVCPEREGPTHQIEASRRRVTTHG